MPWRKTRDGRSRNLSFMGLPASGSGNGARHRMAIVDAAATFP